MKIAVDLDGTISSYPEFFSLLTKAMADAGCEIHIVTDRPPGTESHVKAQLAQCEITYHHLKITSDKAAYILRNNITVLFDDVDRYFADLPPSVAVFKTRQQYNYNFQKKKWL